MSNRPTLTPSLIRLTISGAFSAQRLYQVTCAPKQYVVSAQKGDYFELETNWSIDRSKESYETTVKRTRIDNFLSKVSEEKSYICPSPSKRIRDGGFATLLIENGENSRLYNQRLCGDASWEDLNHFSSEFISAVTTIIMQDLGVDLEEYFKVR